MSTQIIAPVGQRRARPGRRGRRTFRPLPVVLGCGLFAVMVMVAAHLSTITYTVSFLALSAQTNIQTIVPHTQMQTTSPGTKLTSAEQKNGGPNAARSLLRINQLDCGQYASDSECATWAESACSAAALTEVIDAYGYHYRITNILQQEVAAKAITPQQGLLDDQGIARTAARFGFTTDWGYERTLDQVIALANTGTPVIVSWPPSRYPPGHLVVVIGGDRSTVKLADSSRYNLQVLSRAQFLQWWAGYSAIVKPGAYSFIGRPTLTASFINRVLASYGSPAAGRGQALYNLGVKYGIDPAVALAFFMHESTFGTRGEARKTMALGNERCISDRPCVDQDLGGYAQMQSWADGFDHWYRLILDGYVYGTVTAPIVGHPCLTIGQAIPVYAPSSDNNDVLGYIDALEHELLSWWSGQLRP